MVMVTTEMMFCRTQKNNTHGHVQPLLGIHSMTDAEPRGAGPRAGASSSISGSVWCRRNLGQNRATSCRRDPTDTQKKALKTLEGPCCK